MKKRVFVLFISFMLLLTGCSNTYEDQEAQAKAQKEKQYACLINELGGYIATQNDTLKDIPLSEVTSEIDKMSYYKGVRANDENMYIIVDGSNPSEQGNLDYFQKYFSRKFPLYQFEVMFGDFYVYIHNQLNDVDFDEIGDRCRQSIMAKDDGKKLPSKTVESLSKTNKIVIKNGEKSIGTITKSNVIEKILNGLEESRMYGTAFLCDGNGFELEMYENDKLIDTIYYWGDTRLIPKSIHRGCNYYSVSQKDLDLRKIIESETDYKFFSILIYSDNLYSGTCHNELELIYEDNKYNYYLRCAKSDEIMFNFDISDLIMTLKYALENGYITPDKLDIYNDFFIKKEK